MRSAAVSPSLAAAGAVVLVLALGVAGPTRAQDSRLAVGVHAGTAGIGPELALDVSPRVDVRLSAGAYSIDTTYEATGVHYDGTLELRNALLLLDWHPAPGGGFRVSLGGGWNDDRLKVSAPISELIRRERPDLPSPPVELGMVRGEASGDALAPYLGLGWGRPFASGRWAVSFDLGVLYLGEPQVELHTDLAAPLPPAGQQVVDAAVADEERRLERELSQYRYLPVLSLGLTYRF